MKYTKFEKARLLGSRALQISDGAFATVESEEKSSGTIAMNEFKQEKLPLKVKRPSHEQ